MKKRINWLDTARVGALIFIMFNHAISRVFDNYGNQHFEFIKQPWFTQLFKSAVTVISWLGVPIFLMITGVLILNKRFETKEDIKYFYKHNWASLIIATEIWSFLGYMYITLIYNGQVINIDWFFNLFKTMLFINKTEFGCMWYMDMIICLYTLLPIFAVFIKKYSLNELRVPIILLFVIGFVLPSLYKYFILFFRDYVNLNLNSDYFITRYLLYVVAGYAINNNILKKIKTSKIILTFCLVLSITIIMQYIGYASEYNFNIYYDSVGIFISSVCLFELFKRYGNCFSIKVQQVFNYISNRVFGVYMLHIFIVETMFLELKRKTVIFNTEMTTLLYFLIPMIISFILILFLQQNIFIRKRVLMIKK